jgi:hypothetical protein
MVSDKPFYLGFLIYVTRDRETYHLLIYTHVFGLFCFLYTCNLLTNDRYYIIDRCHTMTINVKFNIVSYTYFRINIYIKIIEKKMDFYLAKCFNLSAIFRVIEPSTLENLMTREINKDVFHFQLSAFLLKWPWLQVKKSGHQ